VSQKASTFAKLAAACLVCLVAITGAVLLVQHLRKS
jgi:hypothetical protein